MILSKSLKVLIIVLLNIYIFCCLDRVPETAPAKKKMIMASTSKSLVKKAPQGAIAINVNDKDDLSFERFKSVASAGKSN